MPYIRILRPVNILMLALGVALGFWLSHAPGGPAALVLPVLAAMCAAGFGNVVNDCADVVTDAISHPTRPLVTAELSRRSAKAYAALLAVLALSCGFAASPAHGIGTLAPLMLLLCYALFFKATPLAGNILVSALVAYGPLFGGILGNGLHRLYVPATLAFLLNLSREIVKDIQDLPGDRAAGYVTTASLTAPALKAIIAACGALYALLVFVPFLLQDFGVTYVLVCLIAVAPLHAYWSVLFYRSNVRQTAGKISSLIKYEMLFGLAAMAADGLVSLKV
jgi:geranylgeranylglycerol-phosphate geranylgeranyltransferase